MRQDNCRVEKLLEEKTFTRSNDKKLYMKFTEIDTAQQYQLAMNQATRYLTLPAATQVRR